jgi:hypothetical protein
VRAQSVWFASGDIGVLWKQPIEFFPGTFTTPLDGPFEPACPPNTSPSFTLSIGRQLLEWLRFDIAGSLHTQGGGCSSGETPEQYAVGWYKEPPGDRYLSTALKSVFEPSRNGLLVRPRVTLLAGRIWEKRIAFIGASAGVAVGSQSTRFTAEFYGQTMRVEWERFLIAYDQFGERAIGERYDRGTTTHRQPGFRLGVERRIGLR